MKVTDKRARFSKALDDRVIRIIDTGMLLKRLAKFLSFNYYGSKKKESFLIQIEE